MTASRASGTLRNAPFGRVQPRQQPPPGDLPELPLPHVPEGAHGGAEEQCLGVQRAVKHRERVAAEQQHRRGRPVARAERGMRARQLEQVDQRAEKGGVRDEHAREHHLRRPPAEQPASRAHQHRVRGEERDVLLPAALRVPSVPDLRDGEVPPRVPPRRQIDQLVARYPETRLADRISDQEHREEAHGGNARPPCDGDRPHGPQRFRLGAGARAPCHRRAGSVGRLTNQCRRLVNSSAATQQALRRCDRHSPASDPHTEAAAQGDAAREQQQRNREGVARPHQGRRSHARNRRVFGHVERSAARRAVRFTSGDGNGGG